MTVTVSAYDPDGNGIGIFMNQYLTQKFASFDDVSGQLSTDTDTTEYAFVGPDGGGIIFHAADGWSIDDDSGDVVGNLDSITFGQNISADADGTFNQTVELKFAGLDVSDSDLQSLFDMASDGNFGAFKAGSEDSLYSIIDDDDRVISGSGSRDSLAGGSQDDVLRGGNGDDRMYGGDGDDRISGGNGNDTIRGEAGNNHLYGQAGDDRLFGGGTDSNNTISGGIGNDSIIGGGGRDKLYGDDGDDHINGARGDDRIYGGHGNDTLTGGIGIDTFVFASNAGDDVITDFRAGSSGKDMILFDHVADMGSFSDVEDNAAQVGGDVVISYDESTLTLRGVDLSDLNSHDFSFA